MSPTAIIEMLPALCKAWRWLTRQKPTALKILIVEDNQNDAELLQMALKKRGLDSEVATSGDTAAGLVRHNYYNLVLLDLRLPSMSGQALLRILSRDTPNTNAVVVCGEPADLADLPSSRFISVIRKPVTGDAIGEMLEKIKIMKGPERSE